MTEHLPLKPLRSGGVGPCFRLYFALRTMLEKYCFNDKLTFVLRMQAFKRE